ncbi:drebrin isoform X2 [Rhinatrema bivittatum]|uniref:drebrin isoform X2 n=1 Tax=Rhinatrema bivittatum TaxID=194408 RepID=UPI00112A3C38|nr:drebrin isoform X2 [Rhinatrema bivittatum]
MFLCYNSSRSLSRALYTYEDGSDDLKLAATGGGGLQGVSSHFENQRVMYGFCSVKEPQTVLPRYVLINWVGEDVPDARKCACASHVAKIAEFLQGVDVIVNASSVEDIDPNAIGQRLANGTNRVASPVLQRLRLREEENMDSVGTTYEKTNAAIEMKRINREQFWEQAKKEEELRKEEERRRALEERLKFEQERMEQERRDQEERERRYLEREQQIEEQRRQQQQNLEAEEAKQRIKEQSIFSDQREDEDGQLKRIESEVEEAAAIIALRTENPLEFFRQQERISCPGPEPGLFVNHKPGSTGFEEENSQKQKVLEHVQEMENPWDSSSEESKIAKANVPMKEEPFPSQDGSWIKGHEPAQIDDLLFLDVTPFPAAPMEEDEQSGIDLQDTVPVSRIMPPPAQPDTANLLDLWQSDGDWESEQLPLAQPCKDRQADILMEVGECLGGVEPMQATACGTVELSSAGVSAELTSTAGSMDDSLLPEPPATFCDMDPDDDPQSIIDIEGPHQMTLSYQHALQEASSSQDTPRVFLDLDEGHSMTNGETPQKEGTQASEGYFSQSQDEEFAQSEDQSAKAPPPVFYSSPPEIDITCWDADPVVDEEEEEEEEEAFGRRA